MLVLVVAGSLALAATLFWPSWWRVVLVSLFLTAPLLPRPLELAVVCATMAAVAWQMVVKTRLELARASVDGSR